MSETRSILARWRTARGVVLGSIVLAGSVATSAAVMYRMASHDCAAHHNVTRAYTYSGIGVELTVEAGDLIVRRVFAGTPASEALFSGARLVAVDGQTPASLRGWEQAIRGAPGTTVELEVAYPCGGQKTVTLTRDVIRLEY